ncbi:YeeE/YedE family protein [Moritella sp. F3]|uniref:YeeE/YedE family protein n=1 Tax=Moritella sp. F3 TaxID=2718882 RepID=UPI0018E1CFAC|nr:YeeE/YedE thiosulfate transporter family protein [Moritella sp. F3]GIC79539.1 membrane protein [Moritella sp. F1]GIC80073.1 membrane protein [Moritella sp. F3]
MTQLTLLDSILGGVILSIAALFLLFGIGKLSGISGIFYGLKNTRTSGEYWRVLFVLGLVISPFFAALFGFSLPSSIDVIWPAIIVGGLLVGIGTRVGSGCTSGHGICGIGRLSARSLAATITFMSTAVITVFFVNTLFLSTT